MELILFWIIVTILLMITIVYYILHDNPIHTVIVARKGPDYFLTMSRREHSKLLKEGFTSLPSNYRDLYKTNIELYQDIKEAVERGVEYYTYSHNNNVYTKVYISQHSGYLFTQPDWISDNNISNLPKL